MTDLPRGWALGPLSNFVTPRGEKVSPAGFPKLPFIGMDHVEAHTTRIIGSVPSRQMKSNASRFCKDDVLYGRLRPYLNKVAQPKFDGLASAEFIVFEGNELIDPGFLRYRLHAQDFVNFASHLNEGDRPRVSFEQIGNFEVLVPPLNEQRRVVERIEALFDEIDRGVKSLHDAKKGIELYRQSLLKSAFEGRLTADWRAKNPDKLEDPEVLLTRIREERDVRYQQQLAEWKVASTDWSENNERDRKPKKPLKPKRPPPLSAKELSQSTPLPMAWRWIRVADIGLVGTGVTPLRSKHSYYDGGDVGWITSGALNDPLVKVPTRYVTTAALNDTNLRIYPSHTLLIALYGEGKTRGKCSELLTPAATNQAIAAIVQEATSANFRKFLKWFFTKNYEDIRSGSSGGVQPNLNLGIIENTPIPLCSTLEAKEIVKRIEGKISQIQAAEEEIETCLHQSNALRQSILKQAFSGKLVPQNPDDEPAHALLARIRAGRSGYSTKKPRRRARRRAGTPLPQ